METGRDKYTLWIFLQQFVVWIYCILIQQRKNYTYYIIISIFLKLKPWKIENINYQRVIIRNMIPSLIMALSLYQDSFSTRHLVCLNYPGYNNYEIGFVKNWKFLSTHGHINEMTVEKKIVRFELLLYGNFHLLTFQFQQKIWKSEICFYWGTEQIKFYFFSNFHHRWCTKQKSE